MIPNADKTRASNESLTASGRVAHRSRFALVLLLGGLVRAVVLGALFGQLSADPDGYREIAGNLLRHGSFALDLPAEGANGSESTQADERTPALSRAQFDVPAAFKPTAYRPPLYPLLLSAASVGRDDVPLARVAVLHWLLGVATVGLTYLIGRRLELGLGAVVAALCVACDPILLNQSALIMTETLATLLAAAALYAWVRFAQMPTSGNAAIVGMLIGLSCLSRPTFLPWLALLLIAVVARSHFSPRSSNDRADAGPLPIGKRMKFAAIMLGVALAALAPWIVRNQIVFAKPIATTTHGGYTLLLGNNRPYYEYLQRGDRSLPWPADDPAFQALLPHPAPPMGDELEYDRITKQLARETIAAQPTVFVRASVNRVLQLWNPLPHRTSESESSARRALRYLTAGWYVALYALAIVGLAKLRSRLLEPAWLGALLLCFTFTAVHSVYWSNLRMRAPVLPAIALLAGAGAQGILRRRGREAISAGPTSRDVPNSAGR